MRWFLLLGALGLMGFIAELIDARFPDRLLFIAFLACIAGVYGLVILRGRARGESVVESLQVRYAARLTRFERGFWIVLGLGIIALSLPVSLTWEFGGAVFLAAYAIGSGVSGKPPFFVPRREAAAQDERPR